jgi:hypothetical protein
MERIGLSPGTEIGGYTVVAPLGSGGMGTVYRAVDGGGTAVALKLLHPQIGSDAAARARLLREVAALRKLRHPAVAAVLDAEADSTEAFLVTELVDGDDLEAHVAAHGPATPGELLDLAEGLREALDAVHAAGVVHRDLKPSNVLVTADGPVLIDFGLAQGVEDAKVTSAGLVVGTPGYLAPEQLDGAEPGPGADWWGWAALLAFAATGRPPFGTGTLGTVLARSRAGEPDLDGLGPLTAGALRRALAADPGERLAPEDLVAALTVVAVEGELPEDDEPDAGAPDDEVPDDEVPDAADSADDDADDETDDDAAADDDGDGDAADDDVDADAEDKSAEEKAAAATVVVGTGAATAVLSASAHDGRTRTMPSGAAPGPAVAGSGDVPADESADADLDDAVEGELDDEADDDIVVDDDVDLDAEPDGVEWIEEDLDLAGGGPGTPSGYERPYARRRIGTLLALAVLVFAAGSRWPTWTLLVVLGVILLVRTVGSAVEAMHGRRERRGVHRSDQVAAAASSPWHLVRATVALLPSLLVAGSALVIALGIASWLLGSGRWTLGENGPGDEIAGKAAAVALGLVVLATVELVWFGPLSAMTRLGARRVLNALAPGWIGALVVILLALAAAAMLLQGLRAGAPIDYAPLPTPTVPLP